MGKTIKYLFGVLALPVTLFCCLVKYIFVKFKNSIFIKHFSNISIENLDSLDGNDFEDFLIEFFLAHGLSAKKTKKSRDYGADIILSYRSLTIAIQCKLYYRHNVSISAIQEINTAKAHYNADIAMVITNSYYTKSAINLAYSNNVILFDREHMKNLLKEKYCKNFETIDKELIKLPIYNKF